MNAGWYFTAPWDPVTERRGDALGLRAGADYFADLLAPGLNNSTIDARWITLLSWCLKWSHEAWWNAGGRDLSRRDTQQARYAWLRPLELLWVARTLEAQQDTGQLRGKRSIARWLDAKMKPQLFSMSQAQFSRYRQVGMYGAYRVVFRTVTDLTMGDGWTPGITAKKLADFTNEKLPSAARLSQKHFEKGTRRWSGGNEERFWLERAWPGWATTGNFLPTPDNRVGEPLPKEERDLLSPALFAAGSMRRKTAEVLANARGAKTHEDLCIALASSSELAATLGRASLAPLPSFTRLADAATRAMSGLWSELNHDHVNQAPILRKIAQSPDLQSMLEELRDAGSAWISSPNRSRFPHEQVATQLADAVKRAKSPVEQVLALANHHHQCGGGRRWFVENNGRLLPLIADTEHPTSDYRFRLRSLCRLAAQCKVADMSCARRVIDGDQYEDEEGKS